MSKLLKWAVTGLGGILCLFLVLVILVHWSYHSRSSARYAYESPSITIPTDLESIAKGRHIAQIRGCTDCHGANLEGKIAIEDPMVGKLIGTNLTSGKNGLAHYSDTDYDRAIRYGIRPDGSPLIFMPAHEYQPISNEEAGQLIAYIRSLPPSDSELPRTSLSFMFKLIAFLDRGLILFPAEVINTELNPIDHVEAGRTVEYGAYLATTCVGCHGPGYAGGKIPGVPPDWPVAANLTQGSRVSSWTEDQFRTVLRTGEVDGRVINPMYMPWPAFGKMTDDEIGALYLFIQSLPAKADGTR